jgi:hypothetical protein
MRRTSDIHVSRIAAFQWWKVSHRGNVRTFHRTRTDYSNNRQWGRTLSGPL